MSSINKEFIDLMLRHAVRVRRYGSYVGNNLINSIDHLSDDIVKILSLDLSEYKTRVKIEEAINKRFEEAGVFLDDEIKDFIQSEVKFQNNIMSKVYEPDVLIGASAVSKVTKLVNELIIPESGFMNKLLPDLKKSQIDKINKIVTTMYQQGASNQDIARRIRGTRKNNFKDGEIETTRKHSMSIARTITNHISNVAMRSLSEANEDILAGDRWVSTLDGRTCPICGALDEISIFKVGQGPFPPAHPQCRCIRVPIVKGFEDLDGLRAAGKTNVSSKLTFGEWLKTQPKNFIVETLGEYRANLLISGKVKFNQFVDSNYRPLTNDELKKIYG